MSKTSILAVTAALALTAGAAQTLSAQPYNNYPPPGYNNYPPPPPAYDNNYPAPHGLFGSATGLYESTTRLCSATGLWAAACIRRTSPGICGLPLRRKARRQYRGRRNSGRDCRRTFRECRFAWTWRWNSGGRNCRRVTRRFCRQLAAVQRPTLRLQCLLQRLRSGTSASPL